MVRNVERNWILAQHTGWAKNGLVSVWIGAKKIDKSFRRHDFTGGVGANGTNNRDNNEENYGGHNIAANNAWSQLVVWRMSLNHMDTRHNEFTSENYSEVDKNASREGRRLQRFVPLKAPGLEPVWRHASLERQQA